MLETQQAVADHCKVSYDIVSRTWKRKDDWPGTPCTVEQITGFCKRHRLGQYHPRNLPKAKQETNKDRNERLAGDLKEVKLLQLKGKLVDVDAVRRIWAKHMTDARILFESIPESIGMLIHDKQQKKQIIKESKRIVNDALRSMARGGEAMKKL